MVDVLNRSNDRVLPIIPKTPTKMVKAFAQKHRTLSAMGPFWTQSFNSVNLDLAPVVPAVSKADWTSGLVAMADIWKEVEVEFG